MQRAVIERDRLKGYAPTFSTDVIKVNADTHNLGTATDDVEESEKAEIDWLPTVKFLHAVFTN